MLAVRSAKNTLGCLIGCAIGDLGAIYLFQTIMPSSIPSELWTTVWIVAMSSGIITSDFGDYYIVEAIRPIEAFKTAIGMSMISMLLMEIAMNVVDYGMMVNQQLHWVFYLILWVPVFWSWPYNYWRLKKHGKCCH